MQALRFPVCLCALLLGLAAPAAAQETITLMWDPDSEGLATGYIVYAGTQSGVYTASQDVGMVTQRTMTLQPGTYYFVVRAYNQFGTSEASAQVSATVAAIPTPPPPPPNWYMYWQHSTSGALAAWSMAQFSMVSGAAAGPNVTDNDWHVRAQADMNGDGHIDLIFQHMTQGLLAVWLMNGNTMTEARLLNPSRLNDVTWRIVAAADFNQDGHPDLIFQNRTSGNISAWLMNGTNLLSGIAVTPSQVSNVAWEIITAGDVNGDGRPDLLWQHQTTGTLTSWIMNGTTMTSAGTFSTTGPSDPNWKLKATADVNEDGSPDLIWHHAVTGHVAAWICNGRTVVETRLLTPNTVSNVWRLVGAR